MKEIKCTRIYSDFGNTWVVGDNPLADAITDEIILLVDDKYTLCSNDGNTWLESDKGYCFTSGTFDGDKAIAQDVDHSGVFVTFDFKDVAILRI